MMGAAPARAIPALNPTVPDWSRVRKEACTILTVELPDSVDSIRKMKPLQQSVHYGQMQIAPSPFAHGSNRLAFYGRRIFAPAASSVTLGDDGSVESDDPADDRCAEEIHQAFSEPELDRSRYMVDLEMQSVAAKLAFDFNSMLEAPGVKVKFLMSKVARIAEGDEEPRFYAMEKVFRGGVEMVKFTNNYKFVRSAPDAAMQLLVDLCTAFSHFTWEHTGKYLLVSDLQGTETKDHKGRRTLLLTDPAIHCPGMLRFGKTNLQQAGVDAFLSTHKCNDFCRALGLPHTHKCAV